MASRRITTTDEITKKTNALKLDEHTHAANFYEGRSNKAKVNFARLEKGLLLFIYIYETAKNTLASEIALWDHRLCYYMIRDGKCTKTSDQCHREHQTNYRQANLCSSWYKTRTCSFNSKCKHSHQFEETAKYHSYIRTSTEMSVYQLIRFIRNFAGHFIDSVITDEQNLYKEVIVAMVHIVHYLSPKAPDSVEHLDLFLEATTINQLIAEQELLAKLDKSYEIPEVFFDLNMNFNTNWYQFNANKRCIDFQHLSNEFIEFFNQIFVNYFTGRLRSRGAQAPWHE
ncbi:unnamed protein product [Adineta ricciae]|uniref:C3H1-type domain-containing protein n=1 Tax=Adineta ricciae TaxID=249248 RepID=A0A815A528_ADIRI|nr:unnamed protein product [Adineta ricciae]CAF1254491.1 unnamed protein product [Adineta ricciae]